MNLKIKDRFYKINYKSLPYNELGSCDCKKAQIFIDDNLDYEAKVTTIRHELTHAFLFEYGLDKEVYSREEVCNIIGAYLGLIEKATSTVNILIT